MIKTGGRHGMADLKRWGGLAGKQAGHTGKGNVKHIKQRNAWQDSGRHARLGYACKEGKREQRRAKKTLGRNAGKV